jgi:uncharacterized protein (TIGR03435 family)
MQMTRLLGKLVTYSLLHATLTLAQPGPSNTDILAPEFEVASIREDESGSTMQRVMMLFESDEFTATHVTLKMLIALGYGIDEDQIIGAPAWTNSDEYEIQARIDSVTSDKLKKLDDDQRKIAQQHMLQALLADRFKLAVHREAKEMPIYSLVIARHGSKLHEVGTRRNPAEPGRNPGGEPGGGTRGQTGRYHHFQASPIALSIYLQNLPLRLLPYSTQTQIPIVRLAAVWGTTALLGQQAPLHGFFQSMHKLLCAQGPPGMRTLANPMKLRVGFA